MLSATVAAPYGPVEVHAVHVPAGTMARREKVLTFRGLYDGLSAPSGAMRVMCGDFNSPQAEHRDGTVEPWGKTEGGVTHAEQMAAELSVLTGLTEHGMRDAFRAVHPHARGQRTVVSPKSRPDAVRRYDPHLRLRQRRGAGLLVPARLARTPAQRPLGDRRHPDERVRLSELDQ